MQVPMLTPELEERFSSQIMCTYVYLLPSVFWCWTFHQIGHVWEQNACCFRAWIVSMLNMVEFQCSSHFFQKWKLAAWIRVICHMWRSFRKVISCRQSFPAFNLPTYFPLDWLFQGTYCLGERRKIFLTWCQFVSKTYQCTSVGKSRLHFWGLN